MQNCHSEVSGDIIGIKAVGDVQSGRVEHCHYYQDYMEEISQQFDNILIIYCNVMLTFSMAL